MPRCMSLPHEGTWHHHRFFKDARYETHLVRKAGEGVHRSTTKRLFGTLL